MPRLYMIACAVFISSFITFFATHDFYTNKIEKIYAEFEVAQKDAELKSLEAQKNTEDYFLSMQNAEEAEALNAYEDIEKTYSELNADGSLSAGAIEWLRGANSHGHSSEALPDSATASGQAAEKCDCGRLAKAYDRLAAKCSELAKERDELAVDRNELTRLYNQVRTDGTQN